MAKRDSTQANPVCHIRQIKVTKTFYEYRLKDQPPNAAARPIPWVQLKGHWLQQAGFTIDTPVKVRVMEGCLVLIAE
jgi:toxic protein SymE